MSLRHRVHTACGLARSSEFRAAAELLAFVALITLVFITPTGAMPPATNAPAEAISSTTRAMRPDAALADVCFVNASLGWAVGDRGVIWHTEDGGTTWREQQSTVTCSLYAVCFINANCGWAVGGEHRPGSPTTRGTILRTDDSGATWTAVPQLILPRLTGVKFFDPKHGIAFGDRIGSSPSGAYTSRDGGDTWQPLVSDQAGNWLAGDFLDAETGALAGPAGSIATLARNKLVHSPLASTSLRSLRDMQLVAPTGGWAVGDGGLVLTTNDLGRSWQTPPTDLPETAADNFDFHAVAVVGTNVWIAGSPGTRIYHSPDGGQTWESHTTGQNAPIRALKFVDAEHGWAVGDLGNILATQDGGRTWQVQRTGGQRAALLALFAQPTDVPLELLADSGAADGYITAVNLLSTPSSTDGAVASATGERSHEALLLAGAASANTAWRFPLPPADLALTPAQLLESLNRENDGRAMHQLETHLVRQLRIWRPDVIITTSSVNRDPQGSAPTTSNSLTAPASNSLTPLIEQLLAQAIPAAADPNYGAELADIGLAPWQVKKVYGLLPPGARGDEMLVASRFSPWLGAALSDFATPARGLLFASHTSPPDTYELKLLFSSVADADNTRGIFAGIALAPGSDARRPQAELPTQDLEHLRQLAMRRRHVQELMERTEGNAVWAGQVSSMIDGLSSEDAGQLLTQLAEGYRKAGSLDLAADTYFLFAQRCPDHPLVDGALTWLVQFYASSETAHRLKTTRGAPTSRNRTPGEPAGTNGVSAGGSQEIEQTSANLPITTAATLSRDDRLRRAAQLADYLRTARPALYAEPSVRFAETTAQRELGFANPAQRFYLSLRQLPASDAWRECAATEEWLAQPADLPPAKKLATCRAAEVPPTLDGKLNEPFWSKADRLRLSAGPDRSTNTPPGEVQIARDGQFLYLAISCSKSPACEYSADESPRPRDSDLTQFDRVTVRLDTDRDYNTSFDFTVDSRGWTRDACWDDATWNPAWYVAADSGDDFWTIEAAIPLAELADKPPAARQVWAVSARRTIPRVGYETWSGDTAANDSPNQFGLLIFE